MRSQRVEALQVAISAIIAVTTGALLYLPRPVVVRAGRDGWMAVGVAALLGMVLAWCWWALYFGPERAPGERTAGDRPGWGDRLLAAGFAGYVTYLAVVLVAQVTTVFATVLPEMPVAVFAAGTALTGWVLAAYGLEAVYRSGQVLFPLMVGASVLNLAVVLAGNVDMRELTPVLETGVGPVTTALPVAFAFSGASAVVLAAAGRLRDPGRVRWALPLAVALSGLLLVAYTAAAVAVLGASEVARSTFPVLSLIRQVRASLFLLRLEILTLFAWLTGAFVHLGLLLTAAGTAVARALPGRPQWHGVVTAVIAAGAGWVGVVAFASGPVLLHHVERFFPAVSIAGTAFLLAGGWLSLQARRSGRPRPPATPTGSPRMGGMEEPPREGPDPAETIPSSKASGPDASPNEGGSGSQVRSAEPGSRRAAALGMLALSAGLFLGGCYGRIEPEQAAVVTVLGIDRARGDRLLLTVEIVGAPTTGPREQPGSIAHRLLQAEGRSLLDAQRQLELLAGREILWSHVNVVLVGRDLARSGLEPVLDTLSRRYTFRRNAFLFVTDGPAGRFLQRLQPAFGAPRFVAFQRMMLRPSARLGPPIDLNAFLRTVGHGGEDPAVPVVDLAASTPSEPMVRRVALFRGLRMVALADEPATRGLYWLTGQQEVDRLVWPCPGDPPDRGFGVTAVRSSNRRSVRWTPAGPAASVRVRIEADVEEWQCPEPLTTSALPRAQAAAARAVGRDVAALLQLARREGIDPVGFGLELHRRDPAAWRGVSPQWRRRLASLRVGVQVDVHLRRTGLTMGAP
ncbi:Ger(x)C family spore germination protein [Thermaerobacter sp. PB12/4term]|uniref:Ger(x)C family spore germination protein n=1 Tax=Thermaerobacter sp. PB12/4term TaxID=2293838 RepID=UPI000E3253D6|nr:Ger(x)C family spore germination protein [Thermaerobacter sp. PB12/4term]QIA27659.1 Ger(x)C family spore germination protein [Thermaerobacter sp. PB12/4term]